MSQKPSIPQAANSVSQVMTANTRHHGFSDRLFKYQIRCESVYCTLSDIAQEAREEGGSG